MNIQGRLAYVMKLLNKKYIIYVIVLIIVAPIMKNLYLYSTYNNNVRAFVRMNTPTNMLSIFGQWSKEVDTWHHGVDGRYLLSLKLNPDSTGSYTFELYTTKINETYSRHYSWSSILPYDRSEIDLFQSEVIFDTQYIVFLPGKKSVRPDTMYSKYQLKGDSLFVDVNSHPKKYTDNPQWYDSYSVKPKFYTMFFFWYF